MALSVSMASGAGCAAGRFRYDELAESDGVDLRDLEDLIADGAAGTGLAPGDLAARRVSYDFAAERDEYRLGRGDVLEVTILGHPELGSRPGQGAEPTGMTIRKDGYLHLPVVGPIAAAGRTLTQLESEVSKAAAGYVVEPQVHLEILRHESQKFFVLGEVRRPGVFPVDGDTTLLEAIGLAGGIPPTADLNSATVIRNGSLLPISLADLLQRGDVSRNVYMKAGDLVYVPDASDEKVYVLGEVQEPGVVPMQKGRVSLAEALAATGGPTPARARRELAVIRGGFAQPVVYRIDLEKALLVDDRIALRPGDRVVVAPTGLSTASRYMQQLLPFLQGVQAIGIAAQGASRTATQAAVLTP